MPAFNTEDEFLKTLRKTLSKELDKKRFAHTMGVAYTALNLAMAHDEDLYNAYLAGLLHDNAKCIPAAQKLKLCQRYEIMPNEAEEQNADLLHAKLGAVLARDIYQVEDEDVLKAIQYHTTGRPGMSVLEKIIYIADYIEPNRKMLPNLPQIRRMAFSNLNDTMVLILQSTLTFLQEKDSIIDEMTQKTYEYYKNLKETAEEL